MRIVDAKHLHAERRKFETGTSNGTAEIECGSFAWRIREIDEFHDGTHRKAQGVTRSIFPG
ncbi:MAG: hypothetical protein ACK56I_36915, partial [bacterium]